MDSNNKSYNFFLTGFFIILTLPLLITPALLSPSAWGKAIIFRIIISVLIFLFIYQLIYKKIDLSNWRNFGISFWILITFLIALILATIFSLDPHFSFWGSPLRGDGSLNLGFIILFAILIFLILKKSDWRKIWLFSIFIGVLVSIIALFQKFGVFENIIKNYSGRPPGTIGGPIFLGLYILLLFFLTISFFLSKGQKKKRFFYFFALLLFSSVILITGSRAVYLGLLIGFFYFILFYPKKNKLILISKILFIILFLTGVYLIYYINTQPQLLESRLGRLSINLAKDDPRFSAWIISLKAIKDYPILGYGPENFSIAFDRYYDPSLPFISKEWGSWYDRAHNFIFEIGITTGFPAIIIYLSLFVVLFWQLQKIKHRQNTLIIHGIQATFFAYLTANLFSFDVFSTYLILFLIIAYSLSLISKKEDLQFSQHIEDEADLLKPTKPLLVSILLILLICFIWFACLKPLEINKDINIADRHIKTGQCQKAIDLMEKTIPKTGIIDSYTNLKYIEMIENCNQKIPGLKIKSVFKTIPALKKASELRPHYTRTWIFLGKYTNILLENKEILGIEEDLTNEIYSYFNKAKELSPKREEIIIGEIQTEFILENYLLVKDKTNECLELNPKSGYCWYVRYLSNLRLNNLEEAENNLFSAIDNGYKFYEKEQLSELENTCKKSQNMECYTMLTNLLFKAFLQDRKESYYESLKENYNITKDYLDDNLKKRIKDILEFYEETK